MFPIDYVFNADRRLLVAADGAPVWPLSGLDEREHLATRADLLNVSLRMATSVREGCTAARGLVTAVGSRCAEQARLYAHLSARALIVVESAAELAATIPPDIIITTMEHWDAALLAIYEDWVDGNANHVPGFIVAASPEALWRQVLVRSAAAAPFRLGLPSAAPPICDRREGELVTLSMHSDGIDAKLSAENVLCSLSADTLSPSRLAATNAPICVDRGYCHRLGCSLPDALASPFRVEPTAMEGAVLLLESCSILQPWEGLIDGAFTLADRLLADARTGVIVAGWDAAIGYAGLSAGLQRDIRAGMPVARAVLDHARSDEARRVRSIFCVLGDPDFRLFRPAEFGADTTRPAERQPQAALLPPPREAVGFDPHSMLVLRAAFLSDTVAAARKLSGPPERIERLDQLSVLLATLGHIPSSRPDASEIVQQSTLIGRELVDLLCVEEQFSKLWMTRYPPIHAGAGPPCAWCGARQQRFVAQLIVPDLDRTLLSCPRCGITSDTDEGFGFSFSVVDRRTILLETAPPDTKDLHLVFSTWPPRPGIARKFAWPTEIDGTMARSLVLPDGAIDGLMRLSLWGTSSLRLFGAATRLRS